MELRYICRSLLRLLFTMILTSSFTFANEVDLVRYTDSKKYPDLKQSYFVDLLELALEASKTRYGDYKLEPVYIEVPYSRTSIMLQRNQLIDITWLMASTTLEKKLQAIYFPVIKGIMGYRIFIIHKDKQHFFSKDMPLAELQKIPLGQGVNWTDSAILLANNFSVVTANYDLLINMLKKERFTYFPRALHEPWLEITEEENLTVENHLLLKYPAPTYFYVSNNNKRLQQRLTFGLGKLLESGKFEQFFLTHKITSDILIRANVKKRTSFSLHNPLLSEKSKELLTDPRLWLKLD